MDTAVNIRQLIINKHNANIPQIEISKQLNVPKSTVNDIITKYKSTGTISSSRSNCGGHNKLLSVRDDRFIARACECSPQLTARQLQAAICTTIPMVCLSTFKNSLRRSGKIAYRCAKSPNLTKQQMNVRLT